MLILMRRYSAKSAAQVIPLWPILAVFSADFRREIIKALSGRSTTLVSGSAYQVMSNCALYPMGVMLYHSKFRLAYSKVSCRTRMGGRHEFANGQ